MSPIVAIHFENEFGNVYYGGQTVTGQVHIKSNETIKMRGIRLKVTGNAQVRWSEDSGDNKDTYTGYEEYLKLEFALIGSRSHDSELYLQPGSYYYPFSFILPADLPATFDHASGHVRYHAKAVIDRPWAIDDTADVFFTVVRPLDLNNESPHLREPVVVQNESPVVSCLCVSGFTEITISVNKGMFVPGETILVQGQIVNRAEFDILSSIVSFQQKIEFCATEFEGQITRTTKSFKKLAEFERPALPRGQTDSWNELSFIVPQDIPPSKLDGCKIINITYCIMVSSVFNECCTTSSEQAADVVIGNIPLRNDFQPPPVITSQPMPYDMAVGYSQTEKTFMDFETKESIL